MTDHKCNQGERFVALETKQNYMAEKLTKIENKVDNLNEKFDALLEKLEDKFVMRTEFKVALTVIGAIGTIAGVLAYFK